MFNHIDVVALINDYERDSGVKLPYEVACRMLVLDDMLSELFEEYGGNTDACSSAYPLSFDR
jgi:hypothetical protein